MMEGRWRLATSVRMTSFEICCLWLRHWEYLPAEGSGANSPHHASRGLSTAAGSWPSESWQLSESSPACHPAKQIRCPRPVSLLSSVLLLR